MIIKGLHFKCTCGACPEQYDVFDLDGDIVGYVRLRWGNLTCEYPDVGGKCIYHASIGDGWTGCFESEDQQMKHLNNIADKILENIGQRPTNAEHIRNMTNTELAEYLVYKVKCTGCNAENCNEEFCLDLMREWVECPFEEE